MDILNDLISPHRRNDIKTAIKPHIPEEATIILG
jgi:hypothetical protein